jgi:hypothetical protein
MAAFGRRIAKNDDVDVRGAALIDQTAALLQKGAQKEPSK